ncbi:MAG TPA: HypC/HybG/HupF family hydrogenase formation chaperone [Nitrospirota bacterium]|nr:HypC/HybG/HupF family hydrogenase formation chaperone [Nitrospirota bacterium]
MERGMCLAVPSKIVNVAGQVATIDVFGARRDVSLMLLPEEAVVGDYVLVHAGFAIQKIDRESVESGVVMHEASIVLSILDIVTGKCAEEGCSTVDSITVRIGKAAGVMPESLQFAFDAAKESTPAKNAKLIIETVPVGGRCNDCKKEFDAPDENFVTTCPLCGSRSFLIDRGREMDIIEIEMN